MGPADFLARARALVPGIDVRELHQPTATAAAAAPTVGCDIGQICKPLVFLCDAEPVLVLARGDRLVDTARLAEAPGAGRVRRSDPDRVKAVTGYAIGGVPPFGHRQRLTRICDRCLLEQPVAYAAAGGPHALVAIASDRLLEASGARAICVCPARDFGPGRMDLRIPYR